MTLFRKFIPNLMAGGVSPWAIVGGIGVVFAVLAGLTIDTLHRQDRVSLDLLAQKGLALMRSFEAGTRAGMMEREWGLQRLQHLMAETVRQPDIEYILIVDLEGHIRVHSDAARNGQRYAADLDLAALVTSPEALSRVVVGKDGHSVLEVYKRFTPVPPMKHRPDRRKRSDQGAGEMGTMQRRHREMLNLPALFLEKEPQSVILVGLDMDPFEAARQADIRRAIGMALVMLVVGAAGVLLLFLSQAYRTTRSSLHREKAFSHHLVEHLPVGVVAVGSGGEILSINPGAQRLLGRSEAVQDVDACLPTEVRKVMRGAAANRRAAAQEIACEIEGRRLSLEVIVAPLGRGVDQQEDLGQVLLLRDLTPLKTLQRAVARNQRLAAVGRLAGGVAHEIRNPLSSIKGFATYFKERSQPNEEAAEMAAILIQEVERLDRVVGQLLDFSRPARPSLRPVAVGDFLQTAFKRIAPAAAEKGVALDLSVAADVGEASLDPDLIHQALLNLYLNALDAMAQGGRLTVGAGLSSRQEHLLLTISDTGRGIPTKGIGQIFDPYFTTKSTGTGLGLAIVHNIVEAHGGEIQVESDPGRGTVFRLSLPLAGSRGASDDEAT
jgi:two-component system sensor histidine kinase HydH